MGLIKADRGTIHVLGQEVGSLTPRKLDALRVRIGYSFQHSALYDSMTIAENVAFPLVMNHPKLPRGEVNDRVDAALESVGLLHAKPQMPAELSGGQQKRVGVARALILKPEVMLYDEPTAGLDPLTCGEINDLIVQVRETHHTSSIVITHDLASAKHVGDRVAMLIDGQMMGGDFRRPLRPGPPSGPCISRLQLHRSGPLHERLHQKHRVRGLVRCPRWRHLRRRHPRGGHASEHLRS